VTLRHAFHCGAENIGGAPWLCELLAWRTDQSYSDRLVQLESRLELAGLKAAEAVPLIAPILNLSIPAKYSPSALSPEQQRRRLLATLVEWVLGITRMQPLIIATEDLQWADPSTLELIKILVAQGATARLLLLSTARPDFRAEWPLRAHHIQLNLNRLHVRDIRTMVEEVTARKALSDETINAVIDRTGGVPLFVEELTRSVLESGDAKLPRSAIPATLHDSLMARLDRLGSAKEVLQFGAVIGGEFSYALLHAVNPLGEEDLQYALQRLADAELLYVRGVAPYANYQFKHALIRDAAYGALLRSRRKELHRLVAQALGEKFPDLKETQPEVLARHWTEADETDKAITEGSRAGTVAHARHAFKEALESYQRAVGLLGRLPQSRERDLRELKIRQSLVKMLHLTKGYSAPETIEATEHAAALAEKSGDVRELLNLMIATGVKALSSGDLPAAGANADQALELALREGSSSSLLARVHALQMMVRYYRGDLAGVEKHFTAGRKFFNDPSYRRVPASAAAVFGTACWNAWVLGRASLAREREGQMMAAANRDDPYEMAFLAHFIAQLRVWTGEYKEAEQWTARALELSEEHQIPWLAALSRSILGHTRAQLGRVTEGINLMSQGMASLLEIGSRYSITNIAASLTEARQRDGITIDAPEMFEQAQQANPDELIYQPEILRLCAQSRVELGDVVLAETDFREAIALAQKMSAKAWELRAAMSLARLLANQGRHDEGRAVLADVYDWFTEGFDTADLKDAKALLDELGA
jgi:tetratricopeptide (TPR) repeat protein